MKKEGLLVLFIIFILGISFFCQAEEKIPTFGNEEKINEGQGETSIEGSSYYISATEKEQATLTIPPAEEGAEPSYESLEGEYTGTLKTSDWEAEGTFSDLVIGNGGIYEAVISGVTAGTTMYFLSAFDDQIFKFTAGSDESAIRVIQFDKDGSLQDRIYIELADGDTIEQGSLFEEMNYNFIATDDDSIYIYKEDQKIYCFNCSVAFGSKHLKPVGLSRRKAVIS